ncbi:bifunctional pyr operon transcriptional regulator/uracil phosphoribosyltransferase PyrR [Candidatus Cyanaurora vandensis]|uniref:bifunctional pyr operon transcriptional regulator/uracil phosphoribosyltransferase PyrR n=1 Tax=Candidatus Cyanaurora vandensis TaxID=2714958 RepID=UPI00257F8D72|nr:bifunctional pyr operon transcriptional regulator/uracil phosphoribosyltransferase PyrR [Candidatus Cyanaurora vandensis]
MNQVELLNALEMHLMLRRLALQILEANRGVQDLVLVGIHTRGVPLAYRLAQIILEQEGAIVPVGVLDVTLYRDDLRDMGVRATHPTDLPADLDQRVVYLVDDVIYKGRTIRAALDALNDYGRPRVIRLVTLLDRGHRELPIHPDYVGRIVPTARHESVKVMVRETDGQDGAILFS